MVLDLSKYAMGDHQLSEPGKQGHKKSVPPIPGGRPNEGALEIFRFGQQLARKLIAARSSNAPRKPAFDATDQHHDLSREPAVRHTALGDTILYGTAQGQQPDDPILDGQREWRHPGEGAVPCRTPDDRRVAQCC